jgi:Ca-activated chloride channel homolog
MHRSNRKELILLALLLALALLAAAQTTSTQPPASAPPTQTQAAPPAQNAPQAPPAQNPQQAPVEDPSLILGPPVNQPSDTVKVQNGQENRQGQAPDSDTNGVFVFRKQVEEVQLHATVVDDRQRLVTNLDRNSFQVFEDGQPQKITSFRHEDIPVALGVVIDNSGSMRDKRPAVNQAAINLVKASNPRDEVFVVNFNDEYYLDQDYTAQVRLLQEALERIESRGGTALYDAVIASGEHLKKNGKLDKKVLLVVTDGEDNSSRESLEQAVRRLEYDNGPTVYTIGILGSEKQRRARRALVELAERTGGVAFFPKDLSEVDAISQQVAHDIRNQYTIGYKPSIPQSKGGYRMVKVEARAPGYKRLQVRTRSGYYAGQERASK